MNYNARKMQTSTFLFLTTGMLLYEQFRGGIVPYVVGHHNRGRMLEYGTLLSFQDFFRLFEDSRLLSFFVHCEPFFTQLYFC